MLSFPIPGFGQQKAIKAYKQRTHFLYSSLNLQTGFFGKKDDLHWMPIDFNPCVLNQLSITYRSKSQRLLQRGYVPIVHLSDVKVNFALAYNNHISEDRKYTSKLNLFAWDVWIKLTTKWDRTFLKIGNLSLPFVRNPKVDPKYSFIPNIGAMDLGLLKDFGLLFKTPVSKSLDLEMALTSGGLLKAPIITGQVITPDVYDGNRVNMNKIDYEGDWLLTFRLGNPDFKKNEFGAFAIMGKMPDPAFPDNSTRVYRAGFDWIHKHKEKFRVTNQLLFGPSVPSSGSTFFKTIHQTNAEFFLHRKWIIYVTNNIQYIFYTDTDDSFFKGIMAGGIAFAINPHSRFRLNAFSNYNITDRDNEFGAFLQLITGFGLRG